MWKNFFGTIGARSLVSSSAIRSPRVVRAALLEQATHRGDVEHGDLVAVEDAHEPVVAEGDELHVAASARCRAARSRRILTRPLNGRTTNQ